VAPSERDDLVEPVLAWYAENARDLPWRRPDTTPWGVLVSEVMLQQTPVVRVQPVWRDWLRRWRQPSALAAEPAGEAVRAWGRLGYPRRALRLHAAAGRIVAEHGGHVPAGIDQLRALPGVGDYTAAAVAAFAHHRPAAVLDTNVRRVLARLVAGTSGPTTSAPTRTERRTAQDLLPTDGAAAAGWSVGVMELGALVCTAAAPACESCPLSGSCRWFRAGRPAGTRATRTQPYAGTDRQCRGRLLALLRERSGAVPAARLEVAWPDPVQRARALGGLVLDGLVERVGSDGYALPGLSRRAG